MNQQELNRIIAAHERWLRGEGGTRADLSGCDLRGLDLRGAHLVGADLRRAKLYGAYLPRAYLTGADMADATLVRANLVGANLTRADLTGAKLTRANLTGAKLTRAYLTRAYLADANLRGTGVTATQLGQYWAVAQPSDDGHVLQIGCMRLTEDEWRALTEDQARQMDGEQAVQAWRLYSAAVTALLEAAKADQFAQEVT